MSWGGGAEGCGGGRGNGRAVDRQRRTSALDAGHFSRRSADPRWIRILRGKPPSPIGQVKCLAGCAGRSSSPLRLQAGPASCTVPPPRLEAGPRPTGTAHATGQSRPVAQIPSHGVQRAQRSSPRQRRRRRPSSHRCQSR